MFNSIQSAAINLNAAQAVCELDASCYSAATWQLITDALTLVSALEERIPLEEAYGPAALCSKKCSCMGCEERQLNGH